jgi:hypothetical protein
MEILIVCALFTYVGYLIGKRKCRGLDGAVLGLFLGPIGWLIMALLQPIKDKRADAIAEAARRARNAPATKQDPFEAWELAEKSKDILPPPKK